MLVVFYGETASGKSVLAEEFSKQYGAKPLVSCTTRQPRPGEVDGVDYHFLTEKKFGELVNEGAFAEYAEYTYGRLYGTLVSDAAEAAKGNGLFCAVLTPGGVRALERSLGKENMVSVYVKAPLGIRALRYIERCGVDKFSFEDLNELNNRANRDFGMFLGTEKDADVVVENDGARTVEELADEVFDKMLFLSEADRKYSEAKFSSFSEKTVEDER